MIRMSLRAIGTSKENSDTGANVSAIRHLRNAQSHSGILKLQTPADPSFVSFLSFRFFFW